MESNYPEAATNEVRQPRIILVNLNGLASGTRSAHKKGVVLIQWFWERGMEVLYQILFSDDRQLMYIFQGANVARMHPMLFVPLSVKVGLVVCDGDRSL